MNILFLYLFIGLLVGFTLYVAALLIGRKDPERVRALRDYVEKRPARYAIMSALVWPCYLKWLILG